MLYFVSSNSACFSSAEVAQGETYFYVASPVCSFPCSRADSKRSLGVQPHALQV
ncbi:hypothetical protein [Brachyspira sp. G79]|uniref:hypothetical protein n=1 Tax=Brachyspira sp. G79 TaxID=1358104 RepID=UPI00143C34B8|nr:hypothetical protein [Brachyspira sp. G79]